MMFDVFLDTKIGNLQIRLCGGVGGQQRPKFVVGHDALRVVWSDELVAFDVVQDAVVDLHA